MNDTASPQPRVVSGLGEAAAQKRDSNAAKPRPAIRLDAQTYSRSQDCVQCGLCLPACPTYLTTGKEADSPRGRIRLIKGLADARIEPTKAVTNHLDLCLDCRACETACPSGVVYHELIETTRAELKHVPVANETAINELVRAFMFNVLPYAPRLRLAVLPVRALQKFGVWRFLISTALGKILPRRLRQMMIMLPAQGPLWERTLDEHYPADSVKGKQPTTATLFIGCAGSVLFQNVNRQTIELLQHAGCGVNVPRTQVCCGAIHHHNGDVEQARAFARMNIDTFMRDTDDPSSYIVNNIAGCGAILKEYGHLLRDDPVYAERAAAFANRVRDISELLVQLGPPSKNQHHATKTPHHHTTYHDACHLAHAQGITDEPREMLGWIEGLEVIPLPESDMCCGAAGTYSLTQPEMAAELGERKIRNIQATGAKVCVTGNPGCAMQIQAIADRLGVDLKVVHPVTLLHEACNV